MEQELINRYKERLKKIWKEPNPYYTKGQFPAEYQEIKEWIDKLEKLIK